jgi:hypothetical protein
VRACGTRSKLVGRVVRVRCGVRLRMMCIYARAVADGHAHAAHDAHAVAAQVGVCGGVLRGVGVSSAIVMRHAIVHMSPKTCLFCTRCVVDVCDMRAK